MIQANLLSFPLVATRNDFVESKETDRQFKMFLSLISQIPLANCKWRQVLPVFPASTSPGCIWIGLFLPTHASRRCVLTPRSVNWVHFPGRAVLLTFSFEPSIHQHNTLSKCKAFQGYTQLSAQEYSNFHLNQCRYLIIFKARDFSVSRSLDLLGDDNTSLAHTAGVRTSTTGLGQTLETNTLQNFSIKLLSEF